MKSSTPDKCNNMIISIEIMKSSTPVKCNNMIISIVMPSNLNVSLFLCYISEH